MIKVTNLDKAYGEQLLFKDASFTINSKEKIGLVGRNGHGKTTLLRLLQGIETPDAGEISLPANYNLGYLEQHLAFSKPSILEETCLNLPREYQHDQWRAKKVLFGLGFSEEDLSRGPEEFSGGYQVRLSLAKVLVSDADLLLLDEPTNYLDILSLRWLVKFLQSWKGELLLITHDRSFLDSVITHTLGIHRRKIRKIPGDTGRYYEQIAVEEEIHEKTRINEEKKRKQSMVFINRFRYKATLSSRVQSRIKALEKKERLEKLAAIDSLDFSFRSLPMPGKALMRAEDLSFSYDGKRPFLIDGFNLTVTKNDRIGIIGKNGKGKSTLMKLLARLLEPIQGRVETHPQVVTGYFEQANTAQLVAERTVLEEVMAASPDCSLQQARNICGAMLFEGDLALKKISVLSGGEKSRVLLGKILATPVNLLLLDEPTNHLDMESSDTLLEAIDSFDEAVIMITHNEMFLHALANRLIVFDRNRILLHEGTYQEFLDRVGWEGDQAEATGAADDPSLNDREASDRKTLRRERAELIQRRSETLRPLEERISRLEASISRLEEEVSANNDLLIRASRTGDGEEIAALSKKNTDLETKIHELYEELVEVTLLHEKNVNEFEDSFNRLDFP